jgi:hypothetical protein
MSTGNWSHQVVAVARLQDPGAEAEGDGLAELAAVQGGLLGAPGQVVLVGHAVDQADLREVAPHGLVDPGRSGRLVHDPDAVLGPPDGADAGRPVRAERDHPVALHQLAVLQAQVVAGRARVVLDLELVAAAGRLPDREARLLALPARCESSRPVRKDRVGA